MSARALSKASHTAASTPGWASDVIHFWFTQCTFKQWFNGGVAFDKVCTDHYMPLYDRLANTTPPEAYSDPEAALAAVIVYDQFPRNMFRKTAKAFATDAVALDISRHAVGAGFDTRLTPVQNMFLYMPFEHSENLADQDEAVRLMERFEGELLEKGRAFAEDHRETIRKFGRFPHRNAALGRECTEEEKAFIKEHAGWGQ